MEALARNSLTFYGVYARTASGSGEGKQSSNKSFMSYEHLHLDITFGSGKGSITERYRNIRLTETPAFLRTGGLLGQIPHKSLSFISYQDSVWPESLGYKQIQTPVSQEVWVKKRRCPGLELLPGLSIFTDSA